ncbi:hypothetical protein HanPSC8_Chr03g0128051 [Helianthus annuus]|nr:hypothetical protein HanPSC8_Chr03g0128051 [Helianthus annuus]
MASEKSVKIPLFCFIFFHYYPSPLTNRPPTHCHSRISITMVQCDLSVFTIEWDQLRGLNASLRID